MRKERIFLILGICVAVLPFLGFPYFLKDILVTIFGMGIIYLSFIFYRETKKRESSKTVFDNFSENL